MAIDHAHEQNNKTVKGDGGVIGLTENSAQLLKWMLSGPEIARLINEFQDNIDIVKGRELEFQDNRHNEQTQSTQNNFKKQVKKLCDVIEEMGNPFKEESNDLLTLGTQDIVGSGVVETVRNVVTIGKEQFDVFLNDRIIERKTSLFIPLKKNSLPLFSCPKQNKISALANQVSTLKQNCSLFAQLYVSCQVREGDLDNFFSHENQNFPPSISQQGMLRSCQKSELLTCVENLITTPQQLEAPKVQVKLIDGAALVNIMKPLPNSTFKQYVSNKITKYIVSQLHDDVSRIDVIWDEYIIDSLKSMTRKKERKRY